MNCGGITSEADGRIWTAEEWFRTSNSSIWAGGAGVTDTSEYNWGRQPFEGGVIMPDNQTVYLGADNTPASD